MNVHADPKKVTFILPRRDPKCTWYFYSLLASILLLSASFARQRQLKTWSIFG